MKMLRLFAFALALLPLALAVAPAPAGTATSGCGLASAIQDPDIRASFERFDRNQSAEATRICAIYLNTSASPR